MKILIVGNGGREHALLWRLRRDVPGADISFTAGNAGMEELAEPVPVRPEDVAALLDLARTLRPELTVVGPEAPLAAGIADAFAAEGLTVFGPRRAAAEIEASKAYAKAFMDRNGIPTASFRAFRDAPAADAYLRSGEGPIVIKASGLSAGKGVTVCASREDAREVARGMLRGHAFGEAGREIVVEELLEGRELSVIALTDGEKVRPLQPARDHKRALEGNRGPNTGGMGAVSPVADVEQEALDEILRKVLVPAVRGLHAEGRSFRGALYAGLMLTPDGPRVIEFNARFGDPETQALLPLLEGSLLDLLRACADPPPDDLRLQDLAPAWRGGAACCVVAAASGYPGSYERGLSIELGADSPDAIVFHAGTARSEGRLVTGGGRVLGVTGLGADLDAAREAAYQRLERISFPGMSYRRDIGSTEAAATPRQAGLVSEGSQQIRAMKS